MTEEEYYARIKAEYEASTNAKLVEWARPYFEGTKKPNSKDRYIVCPVSDRVAQDIFELTGSDVRGFNHVFQSDVIKHICNEHGNNGKSDHSVSDIAHIGRVAYVLNNYDEIIEGSRRSGGFKNKSNERANTIVFIKRLNGQVFAAEAITDSLKNKQLFITSLYLKRYKENSTQKRESVITDQNNDLRPNVQNEADSVTSILPQPEKNVNSLEEKSCDPSHRQTERQRTTDDDRAKIAAEMAEIKAELRGKSPSEIAEMSRQARQKNKQIGNNANGNGGKPSSGNGSGGSSGR